MECPGCHFENADGARFCGECGSSLMPDPTCARCGSSNPATLKFCNGCGNPLSEAPLMAERNPPHAYTPNHLAEKILRSRSGLEGERKQVTVLFADVKGSMELASQLDPERWHGVIDRFFQLLAAGVHRFEGTVNQYTGDGIMALFGAPIAHEDHAQRACFAALHLRHEIRRCGDAPRLSEGIDFAVRIGINSGALVELTGARVHEPHVHEVRADLARQVGDQAAREHELREAHRLFIAMGATGHAERLAAVTRASRRRSSRSRSRTGRGSR